MSLYERASVIAGRSCTRSKAPDRLRRAWARHAEGAEIIDTEGKRYLDFVCGLGAISLGYRTDGTGWHGVTSLPHMLEVQAAGEVLDYVAPWASSVRFVKTGSEATHAAYRIAKEKTGRERVGIAQTAYHGWHDWSAWRNRDDIYEYKINYEMDGLGTLAAVFVEPLRFSEMDRDWLQRVRDACTARGALLVFDSMIYGGRWALGGASEYFGVTPDLECFGKAFGNGEAIAFVVGREALAERGEIVSGTFSGDTTGLGALLATLETYRTEPVIRRLWERGLALRDLFDRHVPQDIVRLEGSAPLQRLVFANEAHRVPFKDAMHERGLLIYPDWIMTMYAHTPSHIDRLVEAARDVCRTLI